MQSQARILALAIALLAITLRALVPAGWMPVSGSQSLILCTVEGRAHIALDSKGQPVKQSPDQGSEHQLCTFGVAANLALSGTAPSLIFPTVTEAARDTAPAAVRVTAHRHAPHTPRGPPALS